MPTDEQRSWLQEELSRGRIAIFASRITDLRILEERLAGRTDFHVARMPMGEQTERERFHVLESFTGCFTLPQIFVHGEFVGGEPELTRWLDEESSRCIPGSALALGLGGLIPFIAGVVPWLWYRAEPVWFISYAAAVLAFMGGVQWGAGILRPKGRDVWIFTLSIIPALAASVMLVMYSWYAILTLLGGFVFVYAVDLWWVGVGCFPIWYSQLRTVLTPIVVLCLIGWLLH